MELPIIHVPFFVSFCFFLVEILRLLFDAFFVTLGFAFLLATGSLVFLVVVVVLTLVSLCSFSWEEDGDNFVATDFSSFDTQGCGE